jgi:hypothetical protein
VRYAAIVFLSLAFCVSAAASAGTFDSSHRLRADMDVDASPGALTEYVLDATAKGCLSCHDGVSASAPAVRTHPAPSSLRGNRLLDHPLGVRYDTAVSRNPQGLRSMASLRHGVCLPENKVSCTSCHKLNADAAQAPACAAPSNDIATAHCPASKELTTDPKDLCLSCHIK